MLRACGSANRATLKRRMNLIGRLNSEEIDLLIVSLQEEIAAAGSRDMCVHDLESSAAKRSIVVFIMQAAAPFFHGHQCCWGCLFLEIGSTPAACVDRDSLYWWMDNWTWTVYSRRHSSLNI